MKNYRKSIVLRFTTIRRRTLFHRKGGSGSFARKGIDRHENEGREEEITVDLVLKARGNMLPDEATGPEDIVTEIIKWFQSSV